MGIIKLALIGGLAYWGVQKISNNNQGHGCNGGFNRRRNQGEDPSFDQNNNNDNSIFPPQYDTKRQLNQPQNNSGTNNAYHTDHDHQQELFPSSNPNYQQQRQQQQQYYPSTPAINQQQQYPAEKQGWNTTSRSIPIEDNNNNWNKTPPQSITYPNSPTAKVNDLVDRAIGYLESGKVSEAKDVLMGKMGFKE